MSRLCLSLTAPDIDGAVSHAETFRGLFDMAELRVDLLSPQERYAAAAVPHRLASSFGAAFPLVLSIRLVENGGRWGSGGESEAERVELLEFLVSSGGWAWVELEYNKPMEQVVQAARSSGTRIIRSRTDLSGALLDQSFVETARCLKGLARDGAVPKLAAKCGSSRHLLTLARIALALSDMPEKILLGLEEYGLPSRILAEKFGSLWTYAADIGCGRLPPSSPDRLNPKTFSELYRYGDIHAKTPLYAVTGQPIAHSRSPLIHNRWLRESHLPGTYIPIRSDDLGALLETCDILGITGLSVTVPHKEEALSTCDFADSLARRIGAANTLIRAGDGWRAHNTDAPGFMTILLRALSVESEEDLKGKKILIIGAGGAARAAVHILAEAGARLVILNRTPKKAAALAAETGGQYGSLEPESQALLRDVEIAIQTTSVGMAPNSDKDPLPWWDPSGCALIYDIIYEPAETALLRRASALGVPTINGESMLEAQAALQFEIFTGVTPDSQ